MLQSFFINGFQKGDSENANIGMGSVVGFDTFSKKGVLKLSKKSTFLSGGVFTSWPTFIEVSSDLTVNKYFIWAQLADGNVVYSADGAQTWNTTNFTPNPGTSNGNGLIFFQGFMFAFTATEVWYWKDTVGSLGQDPTNGSWVNWTSTKALPALIYLPISPINGTHYPYLYPSSRGVYFCNGGQIGFFGQNGTTTFNPAGVLGTDFLYNGSIFQAPSLTYAFTGIDFLPPSNLALSAFPYKSSGQSGDLILWDTVSTNKFSPPLRLFGDNQSVNPSILSGLGVASGIKQMINRNQVLYVVSGGNHTVFETNGSSFNVVEDIALYSNMRLAGGAEVGVPVFYQSFPSAICAIGNRIYTGTATPKNNNTYPPSLAGIYPVGVWSITFAPSGEKSTQCEFTIPLGGSLIAPSGNGNYAAVTALKPITAPSGSTKLLVGFAFSSNQLPNTYGMAFVDLYNYIDDMNYTALESPLYEIGTALNPTVVNNIEINLVKNLLTGQQIEVSYRKGSDQNWTVMQTFIGDGTQNFYKVTQNTMSATRFVQLRIRMATNVAGGGNPTQSPEIRSIKLS